jgi:hypothetical protein
MITFCYDASDCLSNTVDFIGEETGWMAGEVWPTEKDGLFLTTNGDRNWISQMKVNDPIQGLYTITANTAFASGDKIYKTADRAKSWNHTFNQFGWGFPSLEFLCDSIGFMTTHEISPEELFISSDGGYSWSGDTAFSEVDNIFVLNDSIVYAFTRSSYYPPLEANKTTDLGKKWNLLPGLDSICHDVQVNSSHFVNENTGYLVGTCEDGSYSDDYQNLLIKYTGGDGWVRLNPGTDLPLNKIYFIDRDVVKDELGAPLNSLHISDGYLWAVGNNGQILKLDLNPKSEKKDTVSRFMVASDFHHFSPSPNLRESMLYEFAMAAIEEEVDFMFIPGDLIIRGSEDPLARDSLLRDWRYIMDTLYHHDIRLYASRGNNDAGSGPAWDSLFSGIYQFPRNGPEDEKNLSYAIEYQNLLFISLDQYTEYHKINQEWLDGILDTTGIEHIFAAGHEPAFKIYKSDCLGLYPEDRNLFWESMTGAGAKAYFSGHAHFYDHTLIDDGDGDPDNDVHQVVTGTGSAYSHPDGEYDGDNGLWNPRRLFHEEATGYVLVELEGKDATLTWKHRTGPGIFEFGGDSCTFPCGTTIIDGKDRKEIPSDSDPLFQNYPNPFDNATMISYELKHPGHMELFVYDVFGRKVATLDSGFKSSGIHQVRWKPRDLQPGIYLCELRTAGSRQVIKMIQTK